MFSTTKFYSIIVAHTQRSQRSSLSSGNSPSSVFSLLWAAALSLLNGENVHLDLNESSYTSTSWCLRAFTTDSKSKLLTHLNLKWALCNFRINGIRERLKNQDRIKSHFCVGLFSLCRGFTATHNIYYYCSLALCHSKDFFFSANCRGWHLLCAKIYLIIYNAVKFLVSSKSQKNHDEQKKNSARITKFVSEIWLFVRIECTVQTRREKKSF